MFLTGFDHLITAALPPSPWPNENGSGHSGIEHAIVHNYSRRNERYLEYLAVSVGLARDEA